MNTSTTQQSWSQAPERGDPMAQMNDDLEDFSNLFDLTDLDLDNIPAVDSAQYAALHDLNDGQVLSDPSARDFTNDGREQYAISQKTESYHNLPVSNAYPSDSGYGQPIHAHYTHAVPYGFQGKQPYHPQQHVPPTPNSLEMHGRTGRFPPQQMDPQHQAMLEQRYQLRKDDAIVYTPMVSPAGTPQYNMAPEFTIPGAYFSPLTSPLLHAQNSSHPHHQSQHIYRHNLSTAPSSNATSPMDHSADVDMLADEHVALDSTTGRSRKSDRRKIPTARVAADPLARVKHSPISKAVKRKSTTMLSSMAPLNENHPAVSHPHISGRNNNSGQNHSQDDGSISPEPLSEALMGPPPRPGSSAAPSPAISGRKPGASPAGPLGKAATPKSLLSMRGSQSGSQQSGQAFGTNDGTPAFEDIQLPEAADNTAPRPSLAQITTQIPPAISTEATVVVSSRKTPKLGPLSTPSSARPTSSSLSPSSATTPVAASTPNALLKGGKAEQKAGRGSKKRGSMSANSSTLVSPALRPRISPSIKPLLPEGSTLNSQTHALLLASKSNYQNLLEGNHLPGVNYPDSLSTGLTSKRTSHKVAEQGRRNRINEALKEMQALLPPRPTLNSKLLVSNNHGKDGSSPEAGAGADADRDGDKDDSLGGKGNSSKAATVESANEYIRKLQKENAALMLLKQEHEELKRKLAMKDGGFVGRGGETIVEKIEEEEEDDDGNERGREKSSGDSGNTTGEESSS